MLYKPTNTRVQILSSYDEGAPVITGNDRNGFFTLFDTIFTNGYNSKSVTTLTKLNPTTIQLTFSAPPGYKEGHLLNITGAVEPVFNKKWRVDTVVNSTITCKIVDTDTYPDAATGAISAKVASLDWEVVYTSATQRSVRSKMSNSSKTILSIKKPTATIWNTTTGANMVECDASKSIDSSTGLSIDSITSPYNFLDAGKSTCAFYMVLCATNASLFVQPVNVNNSNHTVPWTVIGDGRVFYIVIGNYKTNIVTDNNSTTVNSNLANIDTERYVYSFGDYDSFNQENTILGNEVLVGLNYLTSASASFASLFSRAPFEYSSNTAFLLKDFQGSNSKISISYMTIGNHNGTSNMTPSTGFRAPAYPNPGTNGYNFFPYYIQESSSPSTMRGVFPFAKHVYNSSAHLSAVSYPMVTAYEKREKDDKGNFIIFIPLYFTGSNSTYQSTAIFSLGT